LQQLANKIEVPFYGEKGKNPAEIVKNALVKVQCDVLIVDSSGRNALDPALIDEIKGISDLLKPDERILVIPADIGQAAREQANAFHSALGVTDVIVTKLDATAKGGGALTACHETGAQVKFITVGETIEDMELYDPEKFVARLIGFPDLETLLEKARSVMDEKKAQKIMKGDFDLDDFYSQVEGMQKMGPLSGVLDMMGMGKMAGKVPGGLEVQEQKMKKWKYALQSMTPEEKVQPEILNNNRISRIARGSGCAESDVRELVANYNKVKKLMKTISPGKLKRGGMGGIFRQFMK
jgi:signal recognition particle subunit SRP54